MMTKRDRLLHTALKLFIERGIDATATASIAQKSGVSVGTLFYHFKNKEELVLVLCRQINDSLYSYRDSHIRQCTSLFEELYGLWHVAIEWATRHVDYFNFMECCLLSGSHRSSEKHQIVQEYFDRDSWFITASQSDNMKTNDLSYIREHFIWNIRMNITFFIEFPEKLTPENIERSFQIYWHGISSDRS